MITLSSTDTDLIPLHSISKKSWFLDSLSCFWTIRYTSKTIVKDSEVLMNTTTLLKLCLIQLILERYWKEEKSSHTSLLTQCYVTMKTVMVVVNMILTNWHLLTNIKVKKDSSTWKKVINLLVKTTSIFKWDYLVSWHCHLYLEWPYLTSLKNKSTT